MLSAVFALSLALGFDEGIVLVDGRELGGKLTEIKDGQVRLEGVTDPIALHEVSSIQIGAPKAAEPAGKPGETLQAGGPLLVFAEGELAQGRLLKAEAARATVQVSGLKLEIPMESLRGFRLREALESDQLFEGDLKGARPPRDTVYVRRGDSLLRVEGVFRELSEEYLTMEFEGAERRIRRQIVQGAQLASLASESPEEGFPATLDLHGGGQIPVYPYSLEETAAGRALKVRFRGARRDELQAIPLSGVERIRLSSDRVLYLSAVKPLQVEETPLIGNRFSFPYRKDLAAHGGPLKMQGKTYRRGLGMHSRTSLEVELGGKYRSFAAVIGMDDKAPQGSGVTFRALADGKELLKKDVAQGDKSEAIALPVGGAQRLRLEVDFGSDGLDAGDYADWADARVSK